MIDPLRLLLRTWSGSTGGRCSTRSSPIAGAILTEALFTFEPDGRPKYNLVLAGRGQEELEVCRLDPGGVLSVLRLAEPGAATTCSCSRPTKGRLPTILKLAKKLIAANPILAREVEVKAKVIERLDGKGELKILPAGDVGGAHGKTYLFVGFDEIHTLPDLGFVGGAGAGPDAARRADVDHELRHDLQRAWGAAVRPEAGGPGGQRPADVVQLVQRGPVHGPRLCAVGAGAAGESEHGELAGRARATSSSRSGGCRRASSGGCT